MISTESFDESGRDRSPRTMGRQQNIHVLQAMESSRIPGPDPGRYDQRLAIVERRWLQVLDLETNRDEAGCMVPNQRRMRHRMFNQPRRPAHESEGKRYPRLQLQVREHAAAAGKREARLPSRRHASRVPIRIPSGASRVGCHERRVLSGFSAHNRA